MKPNTPCIIGIGQTAYTKWNQPLAASEPQLAGEAILAAAKDAGISAHDLDGITSFGGDATEPPLIQAMLGMKELRVSAMVWAGGGGGSCGAVDLAAMAVASGQAKYVAAMRSLAQGQTGRFGKYDPNWRHASFTHPFGLHVPAQLLALVVRRHMHEYGTTHEQIGAFAIACRDHAQRNPAAVMRGRPLDMETYLAARIIADPLKLYDCCLETNGSCAVIVTTWERARDLGKIPVPILSSVHGSSDGWSSGPLGAFNMPIDRFTTMGARHLADELYGKAGVTPADLDVAQVYDNFSAVAMIAMEDFSLCGRGESGPFCASGAISWPNGALPVNTHGGNLSEAYTHGLNHVVEGVRQMRGNSTCQVEGAELCLVTGGPGPAPTSGLIGKGVMQSDGITLVDRLYQHGRERGDAPALQDANTIVTWAALDVRTNRIANALRAAGVAKGMRVAVMGDTNVESALLLLGALKAGASCVPVPTLVGTDAIARMIEDSAARVLFVSASCKAYVTPELLALPAMHVGIDFTDNTFISLQDFLGFANDAAPDVAIGLADEFNIIYSSGTTGKPKGIVHSHELRAVSAVEFGRVSFPLGARTLATTALYSNWTMNALMYTLWAGGHVRFLGKFSPAELVRVSAEFKPDNAFLVPVQIARLLDDPDCAKALPGLAPCMKWCAGSFLAAERKRALIEAWSGGFTEIYGTTEGAPFTMLFGHERPDKLHTVGRSDPPEDVKIIGEDDNEVTIGERGEIAGRASGVMDGYNNNPAATEALIWRDAKGDTFYRSGDIGCLDEEGFLQVTDRKKDMIISGGFNIYASDLEEVLLGHPLVSEAAVFALISAKWGETPAAAVVLKRGASLSDGELLQWANTRLGRLQHLSALAIADELPRGSLDKVLKRELRAKYAYLGNTGNP